FIGSGGNRVRPLDAFHANRDVLTGLERKLALRLKPQNEQVVGEILASDDGGSRQFRMAGAGLHLAWTILLAWHRSPQPDPARLCPTRRHVARPGAGQTSFEAERFDG